ncbi:MAG: tRNA uridine-5-carboxymethylaminomethyl(34) synthesis GTPase MnmE, partial [Bacteroidetes bacterium]|nr:tRNA uridine-5-carboxymethylaminomethyl(34) synthesis GTPase MnmE [Bacteroidota bacterium]MBS1630504.1 tRNA uridine-5-carboxymethylaminomethyl(34) synthesis GTPase MnmE [Bacteroidota bacterium]
MIQELEDTITALSTPPGSGALGIIRLSGNQAIEIADKIFAGKPLHLQASHSLHFGRIVRRLPAPQAENTDTESQEAIDEAVVSLFRAPHSYTGEDVVEISCHGSPYVLQTVLDLCVASGARPARAGEFTQRAFLNGRLDLTQAEAVADLIAAESKAAQQTALHQLRGGFSADLKTMREELIRFSALIELELDFSQEDVHFADRGQLLNLLDRLEQSAQKLIDSFRLGNAMKNGVSVAIIGAPNAGKSTLLNALINEDRAIVSDIAGTTRDTIEERINIGDIQFRFIDTAGLREDSGDVIEQQGMARSRQKVEEADIILCLQDCTQAEDAGFKKLQEWLQSFSKPHFLLFTKSDLLLTPVSIPNQALLMSAHTGEGLELLKEYLLSSVTTGRVQAGDTIITNTRHLAALQKIAASVREIRRGLNDGLPGDLLASDIRLALFHIGELTGAVQVDRDILGAIFGSFCIGK